jgi:hypothetical protein
MLPLPDAGRLELSWLPHSLYTDLQLDVHVPHYCIGSVSVHCCRFNDVAVWTSLRIHTGARRTRGQLVNGAPLPPNLGEIIAGA